MAEVQPPRGVREHAQHVALFLHPRRGWLGVPVRSPCRRPFRLGLSKVVRRQRRRLARSCGQRCYAASSHRRPGAAAQHGCEPILNCERPLFYTKKSVRACAARRTRHLIMPVEAHTDPQRKRCWKAATVTLSNAPAYSSAICKARRAVRDTPPQARMHAIHSRTCVLNKQAATRLFSFQRCARRAMAATVFTCHYKCACPP